MKKSDDIQLIIIGQVANYFGKNGEVKVTLLTDFPERFKELSLVILSLNGKNIDIEAKIENVKYHKNYVILKLNIANSIDEALNLKNFFLCVKKEDVYILPEGSFYIHDLIGLEVYTAEGELIGILDDIYKGGYHDIFHIINGTKEIMIPAVKKFFDEIKPESGKIILLSKEGLCEA